MKDSVILDVSVPFFFLAVYFSYHWCNILCCVSWSIRC